MSTKLSRYITKARGLCLAVCAVVLVFSAAPSIAHAADAATQPAASSPPATVDSVPASADKAGSGSEAEQHFSRGVELYNSNLFLEALSEFNRALALDPQMENAKVYREKCNGKLQVSASGGDPTTAPSFETVDPAAVQTPQETPQLSAEEMKVKRVAELLKSAERYLANERNKKAVQLFEEVLIIAPDNQRAQEGLHKATIGVNAEASTKAEQQVEEDKSKIGRYIEEGKKLPQGADPTGIKPYRITVPVEEEEYVEPQKKSTIEKILESPVGIEFENIHLSEVVEFISTSWEVNVVIDDRVVKRLSKAAPAAPAQAGPAPGPYPGMPGPIGGGKQPPRPGVGTNVPGRPPFGGATNAPGGMQPMGGANMGGAQGGGYAGGADYVTDGIVPYINLKDVTLREALKALLRPLNLDFSVQPGFIWISTPQRIREESFEELETRYYELRNAGAETLFKIVLRNPGGMGGGMMGGMGGGMMGGMGGMGGGMGGYGGGRMGGMGGGMGGYGGGMGGGMMGGGMGGYGGGGMMGGGMGGYGGGMGGGMMGGGMGGYGGGGMMGGGMGGMGGGMMGGRGGMMGGMGGGGVQIQNISQLFGSISDSMVGETPAIVGTAGLSAGGTGNVGGARAGGGAYSGGTQAAYGQQAGLGGTAGRAQNVSGDEPEIVRLLRLLVNDVYEPGGDEPISRMIYVPHTNQLIVHNTPTNLANLEKQLAELDITPKQVSIEAKFLTIKANDLKNIGFKWDVTQSDQNNRAAKIPSLDTSTYNYDINGDGVSEAIPFYNRPDGSSVLRNTITSAVASALTGAPSAAGTAGAFSLAGIITDNADGDKLGLTFDYLNSLEESELLSAPRVTTMNRKPAVIADLSTEYFVSSVYTDIIASEAGFGGTSALGYTQSVTPMPFNFGITLSVTPQISGGDQVRLWLNPQVTTRGTEKSFTQTSVINGEKIDSTITLPNTQTQAVWTNVIVHDGDTLVLGGLVSDNTVKSHYKMPYLADIPVVGYFFRGKSKSARQSSLLIFVTPTIIDPTGSKFFEAGASSTQPSRRTATVKGPNAPKTDTKAGDAGDTLVVPEKEAAPAESAPAEKPADATTKS